MEHKLNNMEVVLDNGYYVVELYNIITTHLYVATAWEHTVNPSGGTIKKIKGDWYTKVCTNPDRKMFAHLPARSKERFEAARNAYDSAYKRSYGLIYRAIPWLDTMPRKESMGEITFVFPPQ